MATKQSKSLAKFDYENVFFLLSCLKKSEIVIFLCLQTFISGEKSHTVLAPSVSRNHVVYNVLTKFYNCDSVIRATEEL